MTTDALGSGTPAGIGAPDPRLKGLLERLEQARRRSTTGLAVRAGIASLTVGLAAFTFLQLAYALLAGLAPGLAFADLGVPAWLATLWPSPVPQHAFVAFGAGVLAAPVALVMAMAKRPEISAVARAADRQFHTDESVSTALEVSSTPGGAANVVAQALVESAGLRSGAINPQQLVPMRAPRSAAAIPVLAALAVLVALLPPPDLLQQVFGGAGPTANDVNFDGGQRLEAAEDLRRIAAILQQDAIKRANPELQAVARQLDILAMEMAGNPDLPRAPVIEEIERLRQAAAGIYRQAGELPGTPRDLSKLLEFALTNMDPDARTIRPGTMNDDRVGEANAEGGETPPTTEAVENDFEAVLVNTPEPEENRAQNPMPGMTVNPREFGGADGLDGPGTPAEADRPADMFDEVYAEGGVDDRRFERGDGELIGAAGSAEAGDFGGVGDRALFGPNGERDPIDVAWEMFLETQLREGRAIRIDLPPLAELRDIDGNAPEGAARWQAQAERDVTRIRLPALDREAVGRYFRALLVGRNQ